MKIEYIEINKIKPYKNNPRLNRKTINKLKEIISSGDVEFNVPIVVDKNNVIVKGHSRWEALKELGYKVAPVIYSKNSDEINNEDRIQDNIVQELSTWKEEELSIEIRDTKIDPKEYNLTFRDLGYHDKYNPDVTKVEVEKARDKFLGQGQPTKDFIELVCPDCGEEFMIEKDEVKRYV